MVKETPNLRRPDKTDTVNMSSQNLRQHTNK